MIEKKQLLLTTDLKTEFIMKTKFKSLLFLAVLVPFVMSCGKDDPSEGAATITFDKVSTPQVLEDGSLIVNGSVKSKEGTTIESIIATCVYTMENGQKGYAEIGNISIFTKEASNHYTFAFTKNTKGIADHINNIQGVKIEAVVKNGDKSDLTFDIKPYGEIVEPTELGAAVAFQWVRAAGKDATGLGVFGLEWKTNSSTAAIVKKSSAVKFVELKAADWTTITTKEALKAAIDAGTDMADYQGISVTADKTYDVALGVRYNDVDYMLHITKSTVKSDASGTTVTVDGSYKK